MSARVKGGEAGLDFGHRVGRALFNPSSPAHACMGRHSGVKPRRASDHGGAAKMVKGRHRLSRDHHRARMLKQCEAPHTRGIGQGAIVGTFSN